MTTLRARQRMEGSTMLLDRFMPIYDFHEVHEITVDAPPDRVFLAVKTVTPAEVPLFRLAFGLRTLPARLAGMNGAGFSAHEPLFDQALRVGFVLLAEEVENREFVLGWIGQFWKLRGGSSPRMADAEGFLAFDHAGYAKAALNFRVEELSLGGPAGVSTETRVHALGPNARSKFAAYWHLISGGSGLVRRTWLGAVKRRAEGTFQGRLEALL